MLGEEQTRNSHIQVSHSLVYVVLNLDGLNIVHFVLLSMYYAMFIVIGRQRLFSPATMLYCESCNNAIL